MSNFFLWLLFCLFILPGWQSLVLNYRLPWWKIGIFLFSTNISSSTIERLTHLDIMRPNNRPHWNLSNITALWYREAYGGPSIGHTRAFQTADGKISRLNSKPYNLASFSMQIFFLICENFLSSHLSCPGRSKFLFISVSVYK